MSEDVRVVALIEAKQGEESAVQQACEACVGPTRQEAGCDMYVLHRDSHERACAAAGLKPEMTPALIAPTRTPALEAQVSPRMRRKNSLAPRITARHFHPPIIAPTMPQDITSEPVR